MSGHRPPITPSLAHSLDSSTPSLSFVRSANSSLTCLLTQSTCMMSSGSDEQLSGFLAHAVLQAERAHTGRGIWDEYYTSERVSERVSEGEGEGEGVSERVSELVSSAALKGLQHCVENAVDSIYHYSRFIVLYDECVSEGVAQGGDDSHQRPVACASGFLYPEVSMGKVLRGLRVANEEVMQWTSEESDAAEDRLGFLSQTFPEGVDFTGRWMIEGVYTRTSCRGRGLASRVIKSVLEQGRVRECKEALITCAVGNTPAYQLYTKLGFTSLGCGDSEECMKKLGTRGFHVLRYVYPQ